MYQELSWEMRTVILKKAIADMWRVKQSQICVETYFDPTNPYMQNIMVRIGIKPDRDKKPIKEVRQ